jgi:hypothetical protein
LPVRSESAVQLAQFIGLARVWSGSAANVDVPFVMVDKTLGMMPITPLLSR